MMVVSIHLLFNTVLDEPLHRIIPGPITWLQTHGDKGVQVFFVLSGFVIVLSLMRERFTWSAAKMFALRRQLRLDAVYWVVMAVTIVDLLVERAAGFVVSDPIPGVGTILRNVLYLQGVTGAEQVVHVGWTLAIEIQFYLFMLVLLGLASTKLFANCITERSGDDSAVLPLLPALLWTTGAASLLYSAWVGNYDDRRSGVVFWIYFALGRLCAMAYLNRCRWRWPFTLGLLVAGVAVIDLQADKGRLGAGLVTTFVVALGVLRPRLVRRLDSSRMLQYLGSRSYSLYLAHDVVITLVMRAGYKVTGDSPAGALVWMVIATVLALVATEVLFRWVERPSVRFSLKVKHQGFRAALSAVTRRS